EFVTVTVTAGFALGLDFGAACAVKPNRVAPASAAASIRVFIRFTPSITTRRDFYAHRVNHLLKQTDAPSGLVARPLPAARVGGTRRNARARRRRARWVLWGGRAPWTNHLALPSGSQTEISGQPGVSGTFS